METTTGDAVWGITSETAGNGVYGFASATTGSSAGVRGLTFSPSGSGVFGESASASGVGVYGSATVTTGFNYGVFGRSFSTDGLGVYGEAYTTTGSNYGVAGLSWSPEGTGVYGLAFATTGDNYGVIARSDSTSGYGVYGFANATTGTNFGVYGVTNSPSGYGVYYEGGLAGTGTKSAIVETQDYGWRHLYAVESPQNWFEDFGQATLAAGEAVVSIESIFAQTVNLDETYHVFLTPRGDFCSLYVADASATSFTVRAKEGSDCEIAFDYRIIAPRLDYEDLRLKPAQDPQEMAASMPAAPPEIPSP